MRNIALTLFGWGCFLMLLLAGLALLLIRAKVVAFLISLATPLQIIVWILFGGVVLCVVVGVLCVLMFGSHRALDLIDHWFTVKEHRYNLGLMRIGEGEAVLDRYSLLPPMSRNPRSPRTEVTEIEGSAQQQALLPALQFPTAPPFSQIVDSIDEQHVPLGFTNNGPVWGTLDDLLSTGVVGLPRYGKSMALRYLVAIAVKIGAELIGWDPHGSVVEE